MKKREEKERWVGVGSPSQSRGPLESSQRVRPTADLRPWDLPWRDPQNSESVVLTPALPGFSLSWRRGLAWVLGSFSLLSGKALPLLSTPRAQEVLRVSQSGWSGAWGVTRPLTHP